VTATSNIPLGTLVVPVGTTVNLSGFAAGNTGPSTAISATNLGIPEPASLGVLALGGLALIARRRKA
jgi:hypothetical protein